MKTETITRLTAEQCLTVKLEYNKPEFTGGMIILARKYKTSIDEIKRAVRARSGVNQEAHPNWKELLATDKFRAMTHEVAAIELGVSRDVVQKYRMRNDLRRTPEQISQALREANIRTKAYKRLAKQQDLFSSN